MSIKYIETNDVNSSRLAEQGPLSGGCYGQVNFGCHHANPIFSQQKKFFELEIN